MDWACAPLFTWQATVELGILYFEGMGASLSLIITLWVLLVGFLIIVSVYYVDFHYWRSGSPDMIAREFLTVKSAWY